MACARIVPTRSAYTQCRQALCTIHHLRELTFLEEEYHQAWAKDLTGLLLAMKAAVEQARTRGHQTLSEATRHALRPSAGPLSAALTT